MGPAGVDGADGCVESLVSCGPTRRPLSAVGPKLPSPPRPLKPTCEDPKPTLKSERKDCYYQMVIVLKQVATILGQSCQPVVIFLSISVSS